MFRATARLRLPEGLTLDDLRTTLERLAGEIMVDLTVGEGGDAAERRAAPCAPAPALR